MQKRVKTRLRDLDKENCERRHCRVGEVISEVGKSHYYTACPFCGVTVKIYVWSIGGGKRCTCGALLFYGDAYKLVDKKPEDPSLGGE